MRSKLFFWLRTIIYQDHQEEQGEGVMLLLLFLLDQTQLIVSSLTFVLILHLHSCHAVYFGAGTLVAALAGQSLPTPLLPQHLAHSHARAEQ